MKRIYNFRLVEGDPNEIGYNEILVIKDEATRKIKDIQKRGTSGKMESLIVGSIINNVKVVDSASTTIYEGKAKSSITTEEAQAGAITITLS